MSSAMEQTCFNDYDVYVPPSLARNAPVKAAGKQPRDVMDSDMATTLLQSQESPLCYDPKDKMQMAVQNFSLIGVLGAGSFGRVFAARHKRNGNFFALKHFAARYTSENNRRQMLEEVGVIQECAHPNVARLFAAFEEENQLFQVIELCEFSLAYVLNIKPTGLEENIVWSVNLDISRALQHVHSVGYLHNDVKPDNMLVSRTGVYKLCDFNVAVRLSALSPEQRTDMQKGDARYAAPEAEVDFSADIYSLGLTLVICLLGRREESDLCNQTSKDLVQLRLSPLQERKEVGGELVQLLLRMVVAEAAHRPRADELVEAGSARARAGERAMPVSRAAVLEFEARQPQDELNHLPEGYTVGLMLELGFAKKRATDSGRPSRLRSGTKRPLRRLSALGVAQDTSPKAADSDLRFRRRPSDQSSDDTSPKRACPATPCL